MIESETEQYKDSILKTENENFNVDSKVPHFSMIPEENDALKKRPDFVGVQKYSKMNGRLRQKKS